MAATVIWIFCIYLMAFASSKTETGANQKHPILRQYNSTVLPNQGICVNKSCSSVKELYNTYRNCVVILGNLEIALMRTRIKDFMNVSFPNLREVTGFLVVYRVNGLDTLGQLFPNLARIRGEQLLNNYGLIIHDMSNLREIGLYSLVKIDRGGVIVWGVPQACFVDTVDWKAIAPRSRHVINPQSLVVAHCSFPCTCTWDAVYNHCWNNMKCQIYLHGPQAEPCHEQCLSCRKTNHLECNICRHFTYNSKCVSKCPSNTIILPDSQYCITKEECRNLTGWVWNNTCIFHCPIGYIKTNGPNRIPTCRVCVDCDKTCRNLMIQSVSSIQEAGHCVYVNGSLTIHVRAVMEAMDELRTYLGRIQEVRDYIEIHGSLTITSLDFLSSLRRIRGRKLLNGLYSLYVHDMTNLQVLFPKNVTESLIIDRGTVKMLDNPILCMNQIRQLQFQFPIQPTDIDVPEGKNGYSGVCEEMSVGLQIRTVNETTALIMFATENLNAHYSVLYVRLPPEIHQTIVPETCSESEWSAVDARNSYGHMTAVAELTSLRPASVYAVCIESFDPDLKKLARSIIYNFTTPVGVPEPPFIKELAAENSESVVIRWVDHRDYRPYLKRYELDVSLVNIHENDVGVIDQCKHAEVYELDPSLHAVVMRPPAEYARGCESMCGILSTVTVGAMVEEFFDVCSNIDCNVDEKRIKTNSSFGKYVKTLVLDLNAPRNDFRIGGLAPYRDYRFSLRACTNFRCSRFARSVVRTLLTEKADIPFVKSVHVDDSNHVTVKWDPPKLTNGFILSYSVEVLPKSMSDSLNFLLPQSWCVLANQTDKIVRSVKADKYLVRVCTRSMAINKACSEWKTCVPSTSIAPSWGWTGTIFGVLIFAVSTLASCMLKRRKASDMSPIVDYTSTIANESEPPAKMFSDFAYTVPLRESKLD